MTELLTASILAVIEGLKLANTDKSRKYIDLLHDLNIKLEEERRRGYDSDDTLVENLKKELKITLGSAQQEMALANSTRK